MEQGGERGEEKYWEGERRKRREEVGKVEGKARGRREDDKKKEDDEKQWGGRRENWSELECRSDIWPAVQVLKSPNEK